jgi:hypothetical protein
VQRLFVVAGGQHHVPQALLGGDELVPVRADHPAVLEGGAVEDLQAVAGRIRKPDHLVDPTIGQFRGGGLLVGRALDVEPVPNLLQACGVRAFPPGFDEPVLLARDDHQPGREIVHPQIQRALGSAL